MLFWAARGLAVAFALFLAMFALDAVGDGAGALLRHLVPTVVVLAVVVLCWRHDFVAAALFAVLGVTYVLVGASRPAPQVYAIVAIPIFLIAVLYGVNGLRRLPASRLV